MSAHVFLGRTLVGELRPSPDAGEVSFAFDAAYASSPSRPVLGRWFEDHLIEPPRAFRGAPLPNFFRNLLPEGALRKVVARRLGGSANPEYSMLLRLGGDLPGAIRVVTDALDMDEIEHHERAGRDVGDPFRFAITGMQPKLLLSRDDDRLTVPLEGQDGYWIAKFGTTAHQELVQNEHRMLEWASACGLAVPEHAVIRASAITNLPEDFDPNQDVLIVRRFDRADNGVRIHQEDFAQVFDVAPEERYPWESADLGCIHYGSIGAVVRALCGEGDYREYMRRLVFMVLSGNADAHLKNWALVYHNGLSARLAPVYDFVSTIVYPSLGKNSALRWFEPPAPTLEAAKALAEVTMDDLLAAASYTDEAATPDLVDDLADFAERARTTWRMVAQRAPAVVRERITTHIDAAELR